MKNLVVATDFSANANQAAHVAMQLAQAQQATLLLLHAYHFWPANPAESGGDFPLSAQAMHDQSMQKLRQLANELHHRHGYEVPIRCLAKEGYPIPTIRAVTTQEKADLLVMATAGSAPQSAQLMGSVASAMATETTVPLLLIPPGTRYTAIRNVVLGIDLDTPPDVLALDTALRFARQFGCVLNVLCVHGLPVNEFVRHKAEHVRQFLNPVPHTFTILLGDEVYDTLLTFAHDNKADLIMMLPQPHNWLRRMLVEGNTERMARLTDIPLLAIV